MIQDVFITNMRKYRKLSGFTQEKLAELCDTEPAYIGQIETGRRCPSLEYAERIAGALGVSVWRLFYDESAADDEAHKRKERLKAFLAENFACISKFIDEQ
ncbi:MAG: helix-turn-helix transcriptional regulator [Spirochaetaceae bacterium]|nr:helix-turn-helix transcriptional regulator [Spirochaetaceae bacterium]